MVVFRRPQDANISHVTPIFKKQQILRNSSRTTTITNLRIGFISVDQGTNLVGLQTFVTLHFIINREKINSSLQNTSNILTFFIQRAIAYELL